MREQTAEEQQREALRRIRHIVTKPKGMNRQEIINEVRRVVDQGLRLQERAQ